MPDWLKVVLGVVVVAGLVALTVVTFGTTGIAAAIAGGALMGGLIGGGAGGVIAATNGTDVIGGILGGVVMGAAMGGLFAFGGAAALGAVGVGLGAGFAMATGVGALAGLAFYSIEAGFNDNWNTKDFFAAGGIGALQGVISFGGGALTGYLGGFDKMLLGDFGEQGASYQALRSLELVRSGEWFLRESLVKGGISAVSAGFRALVSIIKKWLKQ